MRRVPRRFLMPSCTVGLTLAILAPTASAYIAVDAPQRSISSTTWYRGNTHAHTDCSDGNATPLQVARWYRDLGYNFLVITDHDSVTPIEPVQAAIGEDSRFLLMAGEEVSAQFEGTAVHLCWANRSLDGIQSAVAWPGPRASARATRRLSSSKI